MRLRGRSRPAPSLPALLCSRPRHRLGDEHWSSRQRRNTIPRPCRDNALTQFLSREHPDAEEVFVTGTFDNWTKSVKLEKKGDVFEKTVELENTSDKIYYKVRRGVEQSEQHIMPIHPF